MSEEMYVCFVLGFMTLGLAVAIFSYFKTPVKKRGLHFSRPSIDEQLKNLPKSAAAVIIKGDGNKKRVLLKFAPLLLFIIFVAGIIFWSKSHGQGCADFMGVRAGYLSLLIFSYVMPIGILIGSLFLFREAWKIIRTGYSPPLDTVVYSDTIAKKGIRSLTRGIVGLVLPVVALHCVSLGHDLYISMTKGMSVQEIIEITNKKCQ
jgi:hypothetical protein